MSICLCSESKSDNGDVMTSRDIENLSVDKVRIAATKTGYIDPCVSDNDREPFYDGQLYLYKNLEKTKDSLVGCAKVQIKGKIGLNTNKDESIKYPIKIVDLKAYAKSGVIFFVVSINEDKREAEQIYYSSLTPYRVNRILKNTTNTTSKNIAFKPFPEGTDEIIEILINFIKETQKQQSFMDKDYSIEELKEKGLFDGISFQYIGVGKIKDPYALLNGKGITLYAKLKNTDISVPVDYIESFDVASSSQDVDGKVSINNRVFYDKITVIREKDNFSIKINNFLSVKFEKALNGKTKQSITFTLCGDLDERLKQIEFLKSFVKYKEFQVDDKTIKATITEKDLKQIHYYDFDSYISDFNDFKYVLDKLSVSKKLDVGKCNQKELNNLRALVQGIKYDESIIIDKDINPISYIKVADINTLFAFQKIGEKEYRLKNFFNEKLNCVAGEDKEPISQFVILKEKDFLRADNINFEYMIEDIRNCPQSQAYYFNLNNLLLEMLKAYDKGSNAKLMEVINNVAEILVNDPELFDYDIARINQLQAIARQRKFTFEEKTFLYKIANLDEDAELNIMLKFCACVLLGENAKATEMFNILNGKTQEIMKDYPIMKFYNSDTVE